jgi:AcrR family transcriptional regulator
MPRSSKAQSEITGRKIREIAREMFAREGFSGVRLEEVAGQAGMTRGAVYHHYASKRALFEAVLDDLHAEVEAEVVRAAEARVDAWGQLEAGCLAFLRASTRPEIARTMLVEGPAVLGWEAWRSGDLRHSYRQLEDVLAALEDAGEIRAGSARVAAPLLSGAMNEAALWLANGGDEADASAVEETLLEMLRSLRITPGG